MWIRSTSEMKDSPMKTLDPRWLAGFGAVLALPQAVHSALSGRSGFEGVLAGVVFGFCMAFVAVTRSKGAGDAIIE
jgi:hypothetical protein